MDNSEIARVIFQLNERESYDAKYEYLLGNEEVLNHLAELYFSDQFEYETVKGRISDTFRGLKRKGTIDDLIDKYVHGKTQEKSKTRLEEFSDVDFSKLALSKTGPLPTPDNYYQILLAARRVKMVYDQMTAYPYFTEMMWDTNDQPLRLPNDINQYYKFNDFMSTDLKCVLNRNVFPAEVHFSELNDAVWKTARHNTVDFYKHWMLNHEDEFDPNVDHFSIDNCFAIKYLGAPKEQWSCTWARVLIMSVVQRCLDPGSHQRYYFVIEGEQNIGKTRFCRMLVPEHWYTSASLSSRDDIVEFYRQTYDKAVVEFAELGGTDRASINLFKRVVTEVYSTFRRMRANDVLSYPKRNVIILTTNENVYLRDTTGDTRAIILKSELEQNQFMNLEGLEKELPGIFAQAIKMYKSGMSCFLNRDEFGIQKDQTNSRDVTFSSDEYELVCDYFKDTNNLDWCKKNGAYLDLIYTHAMGEWDMMKPELMRKSRAFGSALVKYGFSRHDNKARLIDGKIRKVWFWKGN
jgi:predicted P-loop ATPase